MSMSPNIRALIVAARLVAVLTILAVHLAASGGGDATAAPITPYPDFWSVDAFKRDCTGSGGSIVTTEGSIACFHDDGSAIVCDENAKNCSYFPSPANEQTAPGPFAGADDVAEGPLQELSPVSPIEPPDGDGVTNVQSGSSSSDSNEIQIYTYLCPSGTDLSEENLHNYQACSAVTPRPAFAFSISVDGVYVGTVTPDQYGFVTLDGLPTGTITAHVGARSTSDKPVAYCWSSIDGNLELPRVRYNVTDDWSVSVHALDPKTQAACAWYYIQPASGKISIHKYECPAGFNLTGAGPIELKQACPPSRTPVRFNLTHPDGSYTAWILRRRYLRWCSRIAMRAT